MGASVAFIIPQIRDLAFAREGSKHLKSKRKEGRCSLDDRVVLKTHIPQVL